MCSITLALGGDGVRKGQIPDAHLPASVAKQMNSGFRGSQKVRQKVMAKDTQC